MRQECGQGVPGHSDMGRNAGKQLVGCQVSEVDVTVGGMPATDFILFGVMVLCPWYLQG